MAPPQVSEEQDILSSHNGQVSYRWRDAKTGRPQRRSVPGADFLWLLLQHVLPKGLQRARNFGFLHHNCRSSLRLLQLTQLLPLRPGTPAKPASTRPVWRCHCGQPMVILRRRMRPDPAASPNHANPPTPPKPRHPPSPPGESLTH